MSCYYNMISRAFWKSSGTSMELEHTMKTVQKQSYTDFFFSFKSAKVGVASLESEQSYLKFSLDEQQN